MAFKIPKNTLICIGILIAVLVGLYFAGFLNKEKLPKFLQEDYENEDSDEIKELNLYIEKLCNLNLIYFHFFLAKFYKVTYVNVCYQEKVDFVLKKIFFSKKRKKLQKINKIIKHKKRMDELNCLKYLFLQQK